MKLYVAVAVLAVASLGLTACGKGGRAANKGPDEFAISRNAPLVVPPDYSLAPPRPGEPRPLGDASTQTQAAEALFGPGVRVPPKSAAEQQLLDKAGASRPDPAIRSNAGDPKTLTVDKGVFLRDLMAAQPGSTNAPVAEVKIGG